MTPPQLTPPSVPPIPKPAIVTALPTVVLDPAGRIAIDVACRKCGYNLRGLLPDGRCPECGTAVGRSLHGDLLRFSDPEWVQKLASGMNWIVASIIIGLLGGAFGAAFLGLFTSILSSRTFIVLGPMSGLVFGLIALVGYWKVTTPDPARLAEESSLSSRKLVRTAQIANYAVTPVNSLLQHLAWTVPHMVLSVVAGIVGLVGTFAIFVYGRKLALRLPDEKLARSCRIVMWGLAVMLTSSVVFGLYVARMVTTMAPPATTTSAPIGPTTTSGPNYTVSYFTSIGTPGANTGRSVTTTPPPALFTVMAFAGSGCILGVGYLIFGIWALRILLNFRRSLSDAAEIAQRTWAIQPLAATRSP